MRATLTALAIAGVLPLSACGATSSGGAASCAGPFIDDQTPGGTFHAPAPTYRPGQVFVLHGHWFTSTCNDTSLAHAPLRLLAPVRLRMTLADGRRLPLGLATPHGADAGFSVPVVVPTDAASGPATVTVVGTQHVFRFVVGG